MTNTEYTNLINYLIKQLRKVGSNDIVNEINILINRSKTVSIWDDSDLKAKNIKQSEVGSTQTIPLTSKEAFESAIDYLSKIIIDIPKYKPVIESTFGKQIVWTYDQSESISSLNQLNEFSIDSINFSKQEIDLAEKELMNLKIMIKENGNL